VFFVVQTTPRPVERGTTTRWPRMRYVPGALREDADPFFVAFVIFVGHI
jgi:hypothetical protein